MNMRVQVQYIGPIRLHLDNKVEEVELSEKSSLLDLLIGLSDKYGDWFRKEILDDKKQNIAEGMVVTINGRAIGQLGGLSTLLKDGDDIVLLPFFAGGG
jgi:molybdopterin converting factor small subunit